MKEIIFATHNDNKAREIQAILADSYKVLSLDQAGIPEDIPEDEETLEGNAFLKARYVFEKYGLDCFADDTGLEVDALGGAPGVYSARYAELSGERDPAESAATANIRRLLAEMGGVKERRARFRTIIALIVSGREYSFEGVVEGEIIEEVRGIDGFGYDPVFLPEGHSETFAEMSLEEKNRISHRALAVRKLIDFLTL